MFGTQVTHWESLDTSLTNYDGKSTRQPLWPKEGLATRDPESSGLRILFLPKKDSQLDWGRC